MFGLVRALALFACLFPATLSAQEEEVDNSLAYAETEFERLHQSIINKNPEILVSRWDPNNEVPKKMDKVRELFGFLPDGAYVDRELVGWNKFILNSFTNDDNDKTIYTASYQYEFENGWAYVQAKIKIQSEQIWLENLTITRLEQSLRVTNAFTFTGKSPVHFGIFGAAIALPLFIIFTFVAAFRTPNIERRKRWLAFILFGLGGVAFNWTTGDWSMSYIRFSLLGSGYTYASELAPVMFKIGLPVGAIMFWYYKRTGKLGLKRPEASVDGTEAGGG